jgi:tetratricopeptide (TPR) repeat protein/predicted Ser/Thr protein kinase
MTVRTGDQDDPTLDQPVHPTGKSSQRIVVGPGIDPPTRTAMGVPPDKITRILPRGTTVGRYMLLEPVGEGGMGVVYRAFDPELDRSVAVKLIRSAGGSEEARARLLREAQALARLSHPNVVAVHDVGTVGDQVFLAMEMLDGESLRDWLRAAPRDWRTIVRAFADAGRGLAAAHRAGLVHRDFKPANAFVETSGRVRLLDFGLARPADALTGELDRLHPSDDDVPHSGIYASVTKEGRVAGTPRYMSPEQAGGGAATALSDQYAFCVALCEALYQKRPRPDTPERDMRGPGPRRLRSVIARGLRSDPAARYSTMDEVVTALDRIVAGRRSLVAGAVLATAAAGAVIAFAATRSNAADPGERCQRADDRIGAVWTAAGAEAVRRAFAATGRPYAADAATRVVDGLARYVTAWSDARREACLATWVHGEQSAEMLDRRMACLDRRLVSLRGYVGVIAAATPEIVDRAVGGLPTASDLAPCADVDALLQGDWPAAPETRAQVAALEARLEEAATLQFAGKYPEATLAARAVADEARAIGRLPLVSEAIFTIGNIQQVSGDADGAQASLDEAMEVAAEAKYLKIAARAAVLQVYVVGDLLGRYDEAIGLARMARIQVKLLGDPPRFVAALRNNLGNVYFYQGRHDEAQREFAATLAIELQLYGLEHIDVAWSWSNLGRVMHAQGKAAEARPYFERAVDIAGKALGDHHPVLAPFLGNLALVLNELGEPALARVHIDRGIRILEATLGRSNRRVSELLVNLGDAFDLEGRHADALAACDEALAIDEPKLAATHLAVGKELRCRGRALVGLGRAADAVPVLERALAILRERTQDRAEHAAAEAPLAQALWLSGHRTRALAIGRQALDGYASVPGRDRQREAVAAWLAGKR